MKFRTKEEEEQHFNSVVKGTVIGGAVGLAIGLGTMYVAARRYKAFRGLRIPTQAFLLTSTTSFGAIFYAERLSNDLHRVRDPMRSYKDQSERMNQASRDSRSLSERLREWGREKRYSIVLGSWLASMAIALAAVRRSPASASQKIVQARVYAQGLTLVVLIATAALEVQDMQKAEGRWETVTIVDPTDPEHKRLIEKKVHKEEYRGQDLWIDMIEAEERRLAGAAARRKA